MLVALSSWLKHAVRIRDPIDDNSAHDVQPCATLDNGPAFLHAWREFLLQLLFLRLFRKSLPPHTNCYDQYTLRSYVRTDAVAPQLQCCSSSDSGSYTATATATATPTATADCEYGQVAGIEKHGSQRPVRHGRKLRPAGAEGRAAADSDVRQELQRALPTHEHSDSLSSLQYQIHRSIPLRNLVTSRRLPKRACGSLLGSSPAAVC